MIVSSTCSQNFVFCSIFASIYYCFTIIWTLISTDGMIECHTAWWVILYVCILIENIFGSWDWRGFDRVRTYIDVLLILFSCTCSVIITNTYIILYYFKFIQLFSINSDIQRIAHCHVYIIQWFKAGPWSIKACLINMMLSKSAAWWCGFVDHRYYGL